MGRSIFWNAKRLPTCGAVASRMRRGQPAHGQPSAFRSWPRVTAGTSSQLIIPAKISVPSVSPSRSMPMTMPMAMLHFSNSLRKSSGSIQSNTL